MKKRPLLWGLGVAVALTAPAAGAQQAATPAVSEETDALTDKARQLYEEGRQAAAAGKWADAHASFLAAWAIKPHYQIASNLGVTCLKLGRNREAAEYLTRYLREAPATKVKERQSAEASLKEALAKVASVTVQAAPAGAMVTVDGTAVGKAPLADPLFLDPGRHEVGARLDGHVSVTRPIVAAAGGTEKVVLQLERTPAPQVVMGPGPVGTTAPIQRQDNVRTVVLVGGGVVAGIGVGAGVLFTVLANGRASDARRLRAELVAEDERGEKCPTVNQTKCADLSNAVDARIDHSNSAFWSFVAGGAVGIGTLIYGLVTMESTGPSRSVQVTPLWGPHTAGVSASGSF
ncbi:PEGA domain-containing protein (plasmid) [Sorangium sp. So ce119]|uniref:PEGA domain-containing protein n=1 Tax=Sorangium sp. So ce119 TaxID=3133279 RepID=UPI003F633A95